jgi:hypothetical protein
MSQQWRSGMDSPSRCRIHGQTTFTAHILQYVPTPVSSHSLTPLLISMPLFITPKGLEAAQRLSHK